MKTGDDRRRRFVFVSPSPTSSLLHNNNNILFFSDSAYKVQVHKSKVEYNNKKYNSEIERLRRADIQYTSPPTMLFTIGLIYNLSYNLS